MTSFSLSFSSNNCTNINPLVNFSTVGDTQNYANFGNYFGQNFEPSAGKFNQITWSATLSGDKVDFKMSSNSFTLAKKVSTASLSFASCMGALGALAAIHGEAIGAELLLGLTQAELAIVGAIGAMPIMKGIVIAGGALLLANLVRAQLSNAFSQKSITEMGSAMMPKALLGLLPFTIINSR